MATVAAEALAPRPVVSHRPWWRGKPVQVAAIVAVMYVAYRVWPLDYPWPQRLTWNSLPSHLDNFQVWLLDQRSAEDPSFVFAVFSPCASSDPSPTKETCTAGRASVAALALESWLRRHFLAVPVTGWMTEHLYIPMLRAAAVSEDKVKLVINHSTSANSLRADDVERVLEYEVYWRIPHDVAVSNSNQLGQPIVLAKPYARASRAISDIAFSLAGQRRERKGFLDRVLGR